MVNTPKTVKTYPLNGSKDFQIPFEYLARKFVVVTLIGPTRRELVLGDEYRFISATAITTNKVWGAGDGYDLIEIRRLTSATMRLVEFTDGSILRAYDLNVANVQSLHISEEARDLTADTIGVNNDGNLDARARRIVNLGDAVDPGDAVTLRQEQEWAASTLSHATQAIAAADSAVASKNAAKASETAAESYKNTSVSSASTAVAAKEQSVASAQEAQASRIAAEAAESAAEAYAVAAFNSKTAAKESEIAAAASASNADATLLRQQLLAGDPGYMGIKNGPIKLDLIDLLREVVDARWYGVEANTTKDNASALAALAAFVRSKMPYPPKVVFPSGIIRYSASPNFAISNSYWAMNGTVLFYYTGTGDALRFDGQNSEGNVYNMTFERCLSSAPANAGFNVYTSSLHHCNIMSRVIGGGAGGWKSRFSVCSTLDVQVTKNGLAENKWLRDAQPQIGFTSDELNPGELLSYCTFPRPIIEHCATVGMEFKGAFGNHTIGGTSEGHGSTGVVVRPSAFNNRFIFMDCEVNPDHDFYIEGRENQIIDCDTEKQVTIVGGASNMLRGGSHNSVYVGSGAAITKLHDFIYNRDATNHTITDLGVRTNMRSLTNRGTSLVHNAMPMYQAVALTPPMTQFTNTTGNPVGVIVGGTGITAIQWVRPGSGFKNVGSTSGQFTIAPGDQLQVYHTGTNADVQKFSL